MVTILKTENNVEMAHFAELNSNNEVVQVIVVHNDVVNNLPFPESEPLGINFINSLPYYPNANSVWKQTSYNNNFRKKFAGLGFTYNSDLDAFIRPKPYPSAVLDSITCDWIPPIPPPVPQSPDKRYVWNDEQQVWDLLIDDSSDNN